jgi:exodeoxyribonuclease V alpha subunit
MDSPTALPTVLEGALDRVVFANPENAWSVVRIAPGDGGAVVTAVGNLLGVQPGERLRMEGRWIDDPKFGRQFEVVSYLTLTPATLAGLEKYLGSGMIRGIGPKMAERLVERFGLDTLEIIERRPERLAEVPGFGPKRCAEIQRAWVEQREIKDLMVFLQGHGVHTHHAVKIYKTYGAEALAVVRDDPYRLAEEVHGIGFLSADRIASALGLPPDAPQRARAGLVHLLGRASERGHVFQPRRRLLDDAAELLGVETAPLETALGELAASGDVVIEAAVAGAGDGGGTAEPGGEAAVYARPLWVAETGLAERLSAIAADTAPGPDIDVEAALGWFEQREGLELAGAQREAIRRGLGSRVLVITGGPGTGKTTLVRGVVRILTAKGQRVLLAAPTGRAAKRLSEATGAEARTVHRLLELNPHSRRFERDADRPLACDLLVVDEASMLDTSLAYHLVKAIPEGARLVLVGDVDQLPSVGPGAVLGELIASGAVDVVRLTEIFRQAEKSLIVVNAHRINRGQMPIAAPPEADTADFYFIERQDPEEVLSTLIYLVTERIPQSFGLDPVEDVQVLTPMNRGPLGTESLNAELRQRLNPPGAGSVEVVRGGRSFRVGDKVMQVRNNYELEVFNGDLGRVAAIDEEEQQVTVLFDGRPVVHDFASLDELRLAYACSIHKSQGSEYPCVIAPIHGQHYVMLQRNLLYTALTRARRLMVLVGERRALAVAVRNRRTAERCTRLAARLRAGGG